MTSSNPTLTPPVALPLQQVNLQTLVAAIQNAVQAQNLIATRIAALTTAFGIAFPAPLSGSVAWTPGGIANGASANKNVTVAGAALGNYVQASMSEDILDCILSAAVVSTNTVTAVIANNTGSTVTFAATTLKVRVTTV